jgi:hypothetical protein
MAEQKRAPDQDAAEGDRATIERELKRNSNNDNGSIKKPNNPGEKVAIATPVEPGDQNAQSMPPSM